MGLITWGWARRGGLVSGQGWDVEWSGRLEIEWLNSGEFEAEEEVVEEYYMNI